MEFNLKQDGNQGAYVAVKNDKTIAEITWAQLGDIMVVDHTFVDDSLRGQGIAKQLVDKVAAYARQENFKIEPVCSYVVAQFERSTAYDDIKVSKV
ncbi:MAG: N-acetyltransferase [Kurthia sp.]|nr:N-acetyltransferase [Candidatus Kurthia equi]